MSETCAQCVHPRIDHVRAGCDLCECDRPYGRRPSFDRRSHDAAEMNCSLCLTLLGRGSTAQEHLNGGL